MDFQMSACMNDENNRWDVKLSGEVDIFNSEDLKKRLTDLLNENCADLYLHCEQLEYIDSTALGALVGVMKFASSSGKALRLLSLRPSLKRLFRITNLDKVFVIEGGD